MDGKSVDLDKTNLMNLGSELEVKIKQAASESEEAWKECGKAKGIEIWRIEKFQVVAWPKQDYGKFFDGDSYIILHTYEKNENQGVLKYHIHMWVGADTSKDEAGTAAYKTVELDDHLGRKAILFRESQGRESELFLTFFKNKLEILKGGIESGFKKIEAEKHVNRLLRVTLKNKVTRVFEVKLERDSLNSKDCFLLDAGNYLYKWYGKSANHFEKFKAGEVSLALKEARKSVPKIIELEQDTDNGEFWDLLGGKGDIRESEQELEVNKVTTEKKMIKLSDASGKISCCVMASGKDVKKELLSSDDVFFIELGLQVIVWIGKNASLCEKRYAIPYAEQYLQEAGLPRDILISTYQEGHENKCFFRLIA